MGVVRVYLLSRHELAAECVALALRAEGDLDVVGYSTSSTEALEAVEALQPHVVVVPDEHDGRTCAQLAPQVRAVAPGTAVVAVADRCAPGDLVDALDAGVTGYLLGRNDVRTLADSLRHAASGLSAVAPELLARLGAEPDVGITGRERQVIRLLARGHSTGAIAEELHVSVHTVKSHVRRAMTKLDAHSRIELVRRAIEERIIARDER